jgi:dolichol-phosphate mannosyltransferase
MTTAPELSVLVPCYNERANVAPMVARLEAALRGITWEVVFIDDDSPDGTAAEARRIAAQDERVRCIRRIRRRGLSSAVIEGALSCSSEVVAVIDGDLQHDETVLPTMLARLRAGDCDIVVGSRRVDGGDDSGLSSAARQKLSGAGGRLAQLFLRQTLSDPMSGFFLLPRALFERLAPRLTAQGFKILVDLLMSSRETLRVAEVPYVFHERVAGESKLDVLVLVQFAALLVDKLLGGLLPLRFLAFAFVGLVGLGFHLLVLTGLRPLGVPFENAQVLATIVSMALNFWLNNNLTYRNQRLRGPAFWPGMILFMLVCGLGAIANIGISTVLYVGHSGWNIAGAVGAAIGLVWNYAMASTLVWRNR